MGQWPHLTPAVSICAKTETEENPVSEDGIYGARKSW